MPLELGREHAPDIRLSAYERFQGPMSKRIADRQHRRRC
jgi:hypothetical protein